jgi:Zn-dependent protease
MEPAPGEFRDYKPIHPGTDWRALGRRLAAPLILLLGLVAKFGIGILKFSTIFVAVGGYALIWGWRFAVGLVLLILVHELGHFVEAKRLGLNPSVPVFVPFLGAYVAIRDARLSPWQHARVAIAGPIVGSLGAAACWVLAEMQGGSRLLEALAYTGFLLNLFNLIPIGFLDGGAIARSFHYLWRGGARGRAVALGIAYVGLALLLVGAMFATHVSQSRL